MEIEDLRRLDKEIWDVVPGNPCARNIYERIGRAHENRERKITDEEWAEIAEAIERLDLIVDMHNACMGFGVGICLREQPDVPGVKPEYVVDITSGHFGERGPKSFDFAWDRFFPLANTERNKRLLAYFKMKPLREKNHYTY